MLSGSVGVFPDTGLANCSFLASNIETCQSNGKVILMSIGGQASDAKVQLTNDTMGEMFADNIWNLFLGGTSDDRPFGNAILDGLAPDLHSRSSPHSELDPSSVDIDIESGTSTGYVAFVNRLRSYFATADKQYYITAAPRCPYGSTGAAYMGELLSNAVIDAVFIQFCTSPCSIMYNSSLSVVSPPR
jgi:chitinase